jgi:DNA-binding MarR family transcriptional regulator
MGELAQALVERGWVVRMPDPTDRRQHLLHLTEQGREHYERAQEQALRRLVPLLDELTGDEIAAVQQALPALRRVLAREEKVVCNGS